MQCAALNLNKTVDEEHRQYSKLLLASKQQVMQHVIEKERAALLREFEEEKNTPESCFIELALQELKVQNLLSKFDIKFIAICIFILPFS